MASIRFCRTVQLLRRRGSWNTKPHLPVPFSNEMEPLSGASSPPIIWSRVLLPQPLGPTTVIKSPSCMEREMLSTAVIVLSLRTNCLVIPDTEISLTFHILHPWTELCKNKKTHLVHKKPHYTDSDDACINHIGLGHLLCIQNHIAYSA